MTVFQYDNGIVELVLCDGGAYGRVDIVKLVECLRSIEPEVRGYVVNRKISYSVSIKAIIEFMRSDVARAVAVVVEPGFSEVLTKVLPAAMFPIKLRSFRKRDDAFTWIESLGKQNR